MSGSSSYYLKNLFSESLAGRKKIFELYPLDFGEFLTFKEISWRSFKKMSGRFNSPEYHRLIKFYDEYIEFGGFPEVVLAKSQQDKKDLLVDVLSSYINIDIKTLADFRHDEQIYSLIKLLGQRLGSRLNYQKLSSIAKIARATLQNYLDFLEKTYLIARLPVLTKNPDREIVKAKKIYFLDNGLANMVADLSPGQKLENAAFTQLHHLGNLSYYARKTGQEIDFIVDKNWAIEVKETPMPQDWSILQKLADGLSIKNYTIVSRRPHPHFTNYLWAGEIK